MTFASDIGSIESGLLVVKGSKILWDHREIIQIVASKRRSFHSYGGRCTFLVLRKVKQPARDTIAHKSLF